MAAACRLGSASRTDAIPRQVFEAFVIPEMMFCRSQRGQTMRAFYHHTANELFSDLEGCWFHAFGDKRIISGVAIVSAALFCQASLF